MNIRLFIYIATFFLHTGPISSQNVEINNIVATDIDATKNDVIEIEFADQLPNLPFILAWLDESGEQFAIRLVTTQEKLVIPIHIQDKWEGKIGLVGLSIDNVVVTIRKKRFLDEWNEFMTHYPLSPGSINFSGFYVFYGQPFRWICLIIMLLLVGLLYFKFRNIKFAMLIGFIVAWAIYDLRSTKNRWDVMSDLSEQNYEVDIYKDLDIFLLQAREIIGDKAWSKERLSGVLNSYCTYQLADLPYKPGKSGFLHEASYIITLFPEKRNVVLNHAAYYLIQKGAL